MNSCKQRQLNGIRTVLISSLCFAVVPSAAKIAMESGASLLVLLLSRCLIGLLILGPLTYILGKPILIRRRKIPSLMFVSLVSVGLIAATYHAIEYISIALVLMIIYLFPIGVALISQIRGEEHLGSIQWVSILGVLIGLGILIFDDSIDSNLYGIVVSVIGLLLFIVFIYFTGKLADEYSSETINLHISFWSVVSACCLIIFLPTQILLPDNIEGWIAILGNGIFYVLSYVLFFVGSRAVGITTASVVALTEPIFAALIAVLVLNQYLSTQEVLGFLATIVSLFFFLRFSLKLDS